MPYFAVTVEHDLNWDSSRGMREQDEWDAHASSWTLSWTRASSCSADPWATASGSDGGLADSEQAVEARLAEDPWRPMGLLRTATIEPWEILLDGRG